MTTCFVIMPFGGQFDETYRNTIKPAIEKAGVRSVRGDEVYSAGVIVDTVYQAIQKAEVCVADVTDRNPNVSYELGMAHALNKPVIIITQDVKDVPFDYSHLRALEYVPGTAGVDSNFGAKVTETLSKVLRDPVPHLALRPQKSSADILKDHLIKIFFEGKARLSKVDHIHFQPGGDVRIVGEWVFQNDDPYYHFCHNIALEAPGVIQVENVRDMLSGRNLDFVELERSPSHLSYMVLFKQFKEAGQTFVVKTDVLAEKYLHDLEAKGSTIVSLQPSKRSGISFAGITEIYHFPKETRYSTVCAKYQNHPRAEKLGEIVRCVETPSDYTLSIRYDDDTPFKVEVGVKVALSPEMLA